MAILKKKGKKAPVVKSSKKQKSYCDEGMIRERAFYIWESMGRPDGMDFDIWIQAEKEMKSA